MEDVQEGGQNSVHSEGEGMKNKEHFTTRSMEFLLRSWSRDQTFYINLRGGGRKFHQTYENVFHPSPQESNDPSLMSMSLIRIQPSCLGALCVMLTPEIH